MEWLSDPGKMKHGLLAYVFYVIMMEDFVPLSIIPVGDIVILIGKRSA